MYLFVVNSFTIYQRIKATHLLKTKRQRSLCTPTLLASTLERLWAATLPRSLSSYQLDCPPLRWVNIVSIVQDFKRRKDAMKARGLDLRLIDVPSDGNVLRLSSSESQQIDASVA